MDGRFARGLPCAAVFAFRAFDYSADRPTYSSPVSLSISACWGNPLLPSHLADTTLLAETRSRSWQTVPLS